MHSKIEGFSVTPTGLVLVNELVGRYIAPALSSRGDALRAENAQRALCVANQTHVDGLFESVIDRNYVRHHS